MHDLEHTDADGFMSDRMWALLDRFLAGECTAEEAHEVHAWLAADTARALVLESVRHIRQTASHRPPSRSAGDAWKRAVERLELEGAASSVFPLPAKRARPLPDPSNQSLRRNHARALVGLAASLTLVMGSAVWWRAEHGAAPSAVSPASSIQAYVAPRGQRLSFRLPDGTLVLLAPESVLRKSVAAGGRARMFHLEGEAYFDVAHDSTSPFVVHTSSAIARDIGTKFVVRAYPSDRTTEVAVTEGVVTLARAHRDSGTVPGVTSREPAVLTAGHLGRVDSAGNVTVRADADLDVYVAWTEGRLVFQDVPLRDAIRQLARWYNTDIRLDGPAVGARRLTAAFDDQPAPALLDKLAEPLGLAVRREARGYTLYAR